MWRYIATTDDLRDMFYDAALMLCHPRLIAEWDSLSCYWFPLFLQDERPWLIDAIDWMNG